MAMHEGICPECGGTEIYVRSGWFHNVVVAFLPPRTRVYVCGKCGYLAEFVEKGSHLQHIRKRWKAYRVGSKRKNDQPEP